MKSANFQTSISMGHNRLFEILSEAESKGYVYGSNHSDYPQLLFFPLRVQTSFEKADLLLTEMTSTDEHDAMDDAMTKFLRRAVSAPISEATLIELDHSHKGFLADLGILGRDTDVLGRKSTYELTNLLDSVGCFSAPAAALRRGMSMNMLLESWAVATHKETASMESPSGSLKVAFGEEQMLADQALLPLTARRASANVDFLNFKLQSYLQGRIDLLIAADMTFRVNDSERAQVKARFARDVDDRNRVFIDRIHREIEGGRVVFVDIGAAHLIGVHGVVAGLSQLGYTLVPVDLAK